MTCKRSTRCQSRTASSRTAPLLSSSSQTPREQLVRTGQRKISHATLARQGHASAPEFLVSNCLARGDNEPDNAAAYKSGFSPQSLGELGALLLLNQTAIVQPLSRPSFNRHRMPPRSAAQKQTAGNERPQQAFPPSVRPVPSLHAASTDNGVAGLSPQCDCCSWW